MAFNRSNSNEQVQTVSVVRYTRADEMNRRMMSATAVIVFILTLGVSKILCCTWATGYFYQVTSLRGTVVGSKFPVLHSFRWFRQSVTRPQAKLILYDYCWPCDVRILAPVKTVPTDNDGKFDFGIIKPGHYYLRIDDEKGALSGWFHIEVSGPPNPKESETIDISPVYPDCTGGHEFIVTAN
jgi:hypothetical protein